MDISLTLGSVVAPFGTMLALALAPGLSVVTVSARSAAFGFIHGASTTPGVVVGDIAFILIAILGLAAIAESVDWLITALLGRYNSGIFHPVGLSVQRANLPGEIRRNLIPGKTPTPVSGGGPRGIHTRITTHSQQVLHRNDCEHRR